MKEQFHYYAVIPPNKTFLDDFKLRSSIGRNKKEAWERFCGGSLRKSAYEKDGFRAKKVLITIEEIK